jgi:hypothetical protein
MEESKISDMFLPNSRAKELVIQETENETLVYDLRIDKAHHLNETMSIIWKNCDGQTSHETLKEILSKKLKTRIEDDFIWVALKDLDKVNLLAEEIQADTFKNLNRRKVLLKYALPAITIPMVMSLVTPVSAQMGSCLPEEAPCLEAPTPCCPGLICNLFESGTCDSNLD